MQTENILALLIDERNKLNRAIEALEGPTSRQGRPPKKTIAAANYDDPTMPDWVKLKANRATETIPTAKRKPRTEAQRKAHGLRMKAYWAAKRKPEMKSVAAPEPATRKRTFTAAQRKQQAERMKALWAKRKAEAKPQAKPKAVRPKRAVTAA